MVSIGQKEAITFQVHNQRLAIGVIVWIIQYESFIRWRSRTKTGLSCAVLGLAHDLSGILIAPQLTWRKIDCSAYISFASGCDTDRSRARKRTTLYSAGAHAAACNSGSASIRKISATGIRLRSGMNEHQAGKAAKLRHCA